MDGNSLKFVVQPCKQLCRHKERGVGGKAEKVGQNDLCVRKCPFVPAEG